MRKIKLLLACFLLLQTVAYSQNPNKNYNRFKQLHEEQYTPTAYRTASGAPGYQYFQQQADYIIDIELNEETDVISGYETITYHNNSPDELTYLWLQLDQNVRAQNADSKVASESYALPQNVKGSLKYFYNKSLYDFDGGFNIEEVSNVDGSELPFTINKTMMRVDLATPLKHGETFSFNVKWSYLINDRMAIDGRSGYEAFEDGNKLYTIAQFFPRMAVYSDIEGWQNKQFLGTGEFALPFGNYDVKITLPADHIIGATGELVNEKEVLCSTMRKRLNQAKKSYDEPVIIVNQDEAIENEQEGTTQTKTWHYKAENVRDFAFASSRKFIWDAMAVKMNNGETVMAMSLYPKEGNPLWEDYSTRAVAHTLKTYSKYTFDYPYPVAYSVHAAAIGMEYPMICFNFGRPKPDGTYSDRVKYGMLGVIIHEVGHNYFPMIVNSDEREWGWMDEGINSFVQYLAEVEFDENFQHWYGPAENIIPYMKASPDKIDPIMTTPDNVASRELGNNAYGKPATALNILRNDIMGHELFDSAFKTYAERWKFKHPIPEDFFRTMEDASGVDLDWFWRGWFYSKDPVDVAIEEVYAISLEDEERQEILGGDKYAYQMKFINVGGLPTPLILEFVYSDGTSEVKKLPAEVWKIGDTFSKVFIVNAPIEKVTFDPEKKSTDIDTSNNQWPSNGKAVTKFDQFKNKS